MRRTIYTPSTLPPIPGPDPLVRYIEQALLSLARGEGSTAAGKQ